MAHPLGQRVQHRDLNPAPAPGGPAAQQGREDPGEGVHGRRDVRGRDARLDGLLRGAGHRDQPGLALHGHVVGALVGVRALGPVPGDVDGDQPRVPRAQRGRVEPEPRGGALGEVLDEDVGPVQQPVQDLPAARVLQVERDGLLAAVGPDEMRGQSLRGGVVGTREVAAVGPLDLDHPGAEVGELAGGEGGRDGLFDGDDGDAVQGQGFHGAAFREAGLRRALGRGRVGCHDSLPTGCDPSLSPHGRSTSHAVRGSSACGAGLSPGRPRTCGWPTARRGPAGAATRRRPPRPGAPPARRRPPRPRRPRCRRGRAPPWRRR